MFCIICMVCVLKLLYVQKFKHFLDIREGKNESYFVELQSSKSSLPNLRFTRHNFLECIQKHEHPAASSARGTCRRYKT